MLIQCPNCATKYNFPDDKFKKVGKVRCTVCKEVFELSPDHVVEQAPPRAPEPAPEPRSDGKADVDMSMLEDSFNDDTVEKGKKGESLFEMDGAEDSSVADEFNLEGDSDLSFDIDGKKSKKRKKGRKKAKSGSSKKAITISSVVLLFLVLAGAAVYFFVPLDFLSSAKEEAKPEEVFTTDQIKNFSLQDVRQYYVDNEHSGKLFVIQGKVINNFTTPKELIKIEANLFDKNGVIVVSKRQYCGNTVSLYQLETLREKELESVISNKVGILTANTNIPSGGDVQFVVVFPNPPDTVEEFGVQVVEAKDPPKK